jgi:chromosome segregation ATPase
MADITTTEAYSGVRVLIDQYASLQSLASILSKALEAEKYFNEQYAPRLEQAQAVIADLDNQREIRLAKMNNDIAALAGTKDSLESAISNISTDLDTQKAAAKADLDAYKKQINDQKKSYYADATSYIAGLDVSKTKAEDALASAQADLAGIETQITDAQSRLRDAQTAYDAFKSKLG